MLTHWSQFVPNMSTDIRGHEALLHHAQKKADFGLAVLRQAGKQKDLGSIPLRLSSLFKRVVVYGHCLCDFALRS